MATSPPCWPVCSQTAIPVTSRVSLAQTSPDLPLLRATTARLPVGGKRRETIFIATPLPTASQACPPCILDTSTPSVCSIARPGCPATGRRDDGDHLAEFVWCEPHGGKEPPPRVIFDRRIACMTCVLKRVRSPWRKNRDLGALLRAPMPPPPWASLPSDQGRGVGGRREDCFTKKVTLTTGSLLSLAFMFVCNACILRGRRAESPFRCSLTLSSPPGRPPQAAHNITA